MQRTINFLVKIELVKIG